MPTAPIKISHPESWRNWGIIHRFYDPLRADLLPALISDRTKLIWLEAAGSVTLEFPDLPGLLRVVRQASSDQSGVGQHLGRGAGPVRFRIGSGRGPDQRVDISVHALTRYPPGGADIAQVQS